MRLKVKRYISIDCVNKPMWSLYVFVVIFAPPIIPYPHLVLAILSWILLLTSYREYVKEIMVTSTVYQWLFGMFAIAAYVMTIPTLISLILDDIVQISHYISLFNRFAVLVFTIVPCATLLICKMHRDENDAGFFWECIIGAGLLEGMTSVLAFLFPAIKHLFIYMMSKNTDSRLYQNTWYITVRSYGFAGTLVDLFGLGIAVIAGVSFFYGITVKRRYILYSMIIEVAALLNARTGVLIYLIAIVLSLIYLTVKSEFRFVFKVIFSVAILWMFASFAFEIIGTNIETKRWIDKALIDMQRFFNSSTYNRQNQSNNEFAKLFSKEFWQMPPSIFRTIIGTGHSLYGTGVYSHSDVGYINDIWFVGIIGMFFLYGMIVKRAIYIIRFSDDIVFRFSAMYVLVAFFVFNIKGAAIGYNPGAAAILIMLFGMSYFINTEKNDVYSYRLL